MDQQRSPVLGKESDVAYPKSPGNRASAGGPAPGGTTGMTGKSLGLGRWPSATSLMLRTTRPGRPRHTGAVEGQRDEMSTGETGPTVLLNEPPTS